MSIINSTQPHSEGQVLLEDLIEMLAPHFEDLDHFLHRQIDAFEPEVRPLVEYTLGHSGKKLRPILVFLSGYSGTGKMSHELIRAAAIVELVHLATLVHDDILDSADMRHRTETVKAKYGDHAAVLLGDALFSHALKLATEYDTNIVCRSVAESTRQVCSGEIAQTFARGETNLSLDRYRRMIDLKTAELFVAAASIGAFLGDGRDEVVEAVISFARYLGIAYQVFDDLSDLLADPEIAGKTLGTDLKSGKFTLPFLLWFEQLDAKEMEKVRICLKSKDIPLGDWLASMKHSGVFELSMDYFNKEIEAALSALEHAPEWYGKEQLPKLIYFLRDAALKLIVN